MVSKTCEKPMDWDRQKKVILPLMAVYPWSVVIEKMEKEHNFVAR
jgi:hypothetical protein